jgi:hypothetical protein
MKIGSQEQVTGLGRAWAPFGAYFRRPEGWWREGPTHHTAQVFSCANGWGQPQVIDESTSFWRRARILWAGIDTDIVRHVISCPRKQVPAVGDGL